MAPETPARKRDLPMADDLPSEGDGAERPSTLYQSSNII
jgi:hypothetical protein